MDITESMSSTITSFMAYQSILLPWSLFVPIMTNHKGLSCKRLYSKEERVVCRRVILNKLMNVELIRRIKRFLPSDCQKHMSSSF